MIPRKPVRVRHGRATVSKRRACESDLRASRRSIGRRGRTIPGGGFRDGRSFHPEGCRQTRCPADFQGPALAARRRAPRGRGVLLHRRGPGRDVGVRKVHGHPRVRARRAPLPRLPLPLTGPGSVAGMEKKLILRGVLAGAIAGLLAFVFARIFAEPVINQAINYESGRDAVIAALDKAAGLPPPDEGPDIFSRTIQANVGIGVGMIAFGAAMGALFAVAYALYLGRVGNVRARTLALLVAGGGFVALYLVPFIKYPANPPSIGHPETIRQRGELYLVMVVASVVLLVLAVWVGQRLKTRFGTWNAVLIAAAGFALLIGAIMALLPELGQLAVNLLLYGTPATETPLPLKNAKGVIVYPGFPADVLFNFRLYSIAAQLVLWGAIGLIFAPLADRLLAPGPARAELRQVRETAGV